MDVPGEGERSEVRDKAKHPFVRPATTTVPSIEPRSSKSRDATAIIAEIDRAVDDAGAYEEGETQPSPEAVEAAKRLVLAAEQRGVKFPTTEVSVYYGEIDLTWKSGNRLLRLVVHSDARTPLLYFQTDTGEAFTRGQSAPAASGYQLAERLQWLSG